MKKLILLMVAFLILGCTEGQDYVQECPHCKPNHEYKMCIICTDQNCTPCDDCEYVNGKCVPKE